MPCPNGVQIAELPYMTAAYRLWSSEWFQKGVKIDLESWDKCNLCGECEKRCPFNLPIREMMKENIEYYRHIHKTS